MILLNIKIRETVRTFEVFSATSCHICHFTHIFHGLYSHNVNEVSCGKVEDNGVNVPGPLAQRPKRDSLQVPTQSVLSAGAQSGGVPVLILCHPVQTGAVWVPAFKVLPSGLTIRGSGSGWDHKHCPVLPLSPVWILHLCLIYACVLPAASPLLHRTFRGSRKLLSCSLSPSLKYMWGRSLF